MHASTGRRCTGHSDLRWKALAARDARRRRHVRLRRDLDRRLLPAELPEPAAARRSRPLLRHDHRGAAGGFRACKRCRPDTVGLAQPGVEAVRRASAYLADPRRSDRDARPPRARRGDEPASPAAPLQGHRRPVAARVSGGGARRQAAHEPARRPRRDDRDLRSRIRIAEPRLRGGADRQGHVAVELPPRRRRHAHRVFDDAEPGRAACWWRPPRTASAR